MATAMATATATATATTTATTTCQSKVVFVVFRYGITELSNP